MSTFQDENVCPECGSTYLYEVNCRTGDGYKLTMCECDMQIYEAQETAKLVKGWIKDNKKAIADCDCESDEVIRLNSELEVLTAIKQELPTAFKKIKKNGRTNSSK